MAKSKAVVEMSGLKLGSYVAEAAITAKGEGGEIGCVVPVALQPECGAGAYAPEGLCDARLGQVYPVRDFVIWGKPGMDPCRYYYPVVSVLGGQASHQVCMRQRRPWA